ncbi:MAG: sulfurtransferase TusA family protein [Desulfobulbaceae bacterium]|jgi:sulfite reductase (ferredoxin)|nr:sulfurtransferase TusA family protein [Desulfobulbaceae bacterium]MDY0350658.1 sulfurtransferase TusA family protein [Desulfobulbaceae bacterium]
MNGGGRRPDAEKNLVGTGCPMNLVYAKFELAKLEQGQILRLIIDDGAPVDNVSRSLAGEGHLIMDREQLADGTWMLLVRKG